MKGISVQQNIGLVQQGMARSIQQDIVIAGHADSHINQVRQLEILHQIEQYLIYNADNITDEFDTTATTTSIKSSGNGKINITNGTVGDSNTKFYLVDRNKGSVYAVDDLTNGAMWLGELYSSYTNHTVENATSAYQFDLEDGQELHVLSATDGIPTGKEANGGFYFEVRLLLI